MAHPEQIEFCKSVKKKFPGFFENRIVVDIGSLDINGSNQYLFENCLYLGIDLMPGKNVDFAVKGHELNLPDESVDTIISTECFEHDQYYDRTLRNIVRMLKPGGAFIFSCATTGRPEHGTSRTSPFASPFTQQVEGWSEYYRNLDESDIRNIIDIDILFDKYDFSVNFESKDLYFWGVKMGFHCDQKDHSFQLPEAYMNRKLIALEQNIMALEQNIMILNRMNVTLQSSKSWRLTKPFRTISKKYKAIRQSLSF